MATMRAVALILLGASLADAKPPNILFLFSDSMDGRLLDPESPVWARVEMPNLRALASRGTNFVRTYAASPQCVPSRTTLFTGRHTHQIEAWSNSQGLAVAPSSGTPDTACVASYGQKKCEAFGRAQNVSFTMVDKMREAGLEPHLYGKVDVGAGVLADADEGNATASGFHGGVILPISARSADIRRATKPDPITITTDEDNNVHPEDWAMVGKCEEFLRATAAAGAGTADAAPWFLYCSVNIPHPAFQTNATWLGAVHAEQVTLPKWLPAAEEHPADSFMSASKSVVRAFNDSEILKVRATYYAMCAETDFLLGRVLTALKDAGHSNDTIVLFISDHGEMNMEHRQVWKNSMYEASARVPMIVAGPGIRANATVTELTSLLDVLPTLVDLAGGAASPLFSGESLVPLLALSAASPRQQGRAGVAAQYHSNMGNTGSFMWRAGKYKLVAFGKTYKAFASYQPQLFDLEADPDELNDLARESPDLVEKLTKQLNAALKEDIQAVDRRVKRNDWDIYKKYFQGQTNAKELRKMYEKAFAEFDDADWAKVMAWEAEAEALFQ